MENSKSDRERCVKVSDKVLGTSAVSTQHQTNIIGAVRAILGLKKGDRIEWVLRNDEIIVRKAKASPTQEPIE